MQPDYKIEWYKDKDLIIEFDKIPHVCVRYALPSDTDAEVKSKKKYPFINKHTLNVHIIYKSKHYYFTICKNYCYDGMTIPRCAWTLIGVSKESNCGLVAALLHDYLTENKDIIENNRALSTNIFNALLKVGGINSFRRFIMKNSVACYQTLFCRW